MKTWYEFANCPDCKREVKIVQKVNRCKCGARIKVLGWSDSNV